MMLSRMALWFMPGTPRYQEIIIAKPLFWGLTLVVVPLSWKLLRVFGKGMLV